MKGSDARASDVGCIELGRLLRLRAHVRSCATCRYGRWWHQPSTETETHECLLLGRTMAMCSGGNADLARVCDGWKRRPSTWKHVVLVNPYWSDPYITRESQLRMRSRVCAAARGGGKDVERAKRAG